MIKIGGSLARLGDGRPVRALCGEIRIAARRHRLLVVPGGGVFADRVRSEAARYRLGATASHWMAVLAMDQYGYLLNELLETSEIVEDPSPADQSLHLPGLSVLLPYRLLRKHDPLPHGWHVTSDAIAVWIASRVASRRLILAKAAEPSETNYLVDPHLTALLGRHRVSSGQKPEALDSGASARAFVAPQRRAPEDAGRAASVTGQTMSLPEIWVVNGSVPGRLAELLDEGSTTGVRLL